jgi:hypothetical protein
MIIATGGPIKGTFRTRDADGQNVAADSLPTAHLILDGDDQAGAVTVTDKTGGRYKFSATAPALTINQVIEVETTVVVGGVTQSDVVYRAVCSPKMALVDNALTTLAIADNALTALKLTDGLFTSAKFADGFLALAKIADGAFAAAKFADAFLTANKIADNAFVNAKFADGAIDAAVLHATAIALIQSGLLTAAMTLDEPSGAPVFGDVTIGEALAALLIPLINPKSFNKTTGITRFRDNADSTDLFTTTGTDNGTTRSVTKAE